MRLFFGNSNVFLSFYYFCFYCFVFVPVCQVHCFCSEGVLCAASLTRLCFFGKHAPPHANTCIYTPLHACTDVSAFCIYIRTTLSLFYECASFFFFFYLFLHLNQCTRRVRVSRSHVTNGYLLLFFIVSIFLFVFFFCSHFVLCLYFHPLSFFLFLSFFVFFFSIFFSICSHTPTSVHQTRQSVALVCLKWSALLLKSCRIFGRYSNSRPFSYMVCVIY